MEYKTRQNRLSSAILLTVLAVVMILFLVTGMSGCGSQGGNEKNQNAGAGAHDDGLKIKVTEEDRTPEAQEQKIIDKLYISDLNQYGMKYGKEIYTAVTITGEAMPEETIYTVRDLEELVRISFTNSKMHETGLLLQADGYYGLNFVRFMELSGMDETANDLTFICEDRNGETKRYSYDVFSAGDADVMLAIGDDQGPFGTAELGDSVKNDDIALMIFKNGKLAEKLPISRVVAGSGDSAGDPEYQYHNHKPYDDSLDCAFTVELYNRSAENQNEGNESGDPVKSIQFTTAELEQMMRDDPDRVCRNYYGTIGNQETFSYAGAGGWIDRFEGIDLQWLLKEKVGVDTLKGKAELVGRDGEVYNTIEDISYFDHEGREDSYYIMTPDGVRIPNAVPMVACVKNGRPILKEHEHESEAYVAYNTLNCNLEKQGIMTEVGVVKNHNGPFTACVGNLDGYYGGEQMETAGDCVLIRLYLE